MVEKAICWQPMEEDYTLSPASVVSCHLVDSEQPRGPFARGCVDVAGQQGLKRRAASCQPEAGALPRPSRQKKNKLTSVLPRVTESPRPDGRNGWLQC